MALQNVSSAIQVLHEQSPRVNGFAVLRMEYSRNRGPTTAPRKYDNLSPPDAIWLPTDAEYEEQYGPQCFKSILQRRFVDYINDSEAENNQSMVLQSQNN